MSDEIISDDKISFINDINKRSNADFLKRLKDPNRKYINNWKNPNEISTHKMSWAEIDGMGIVYPEIQNINNKLYDFTNPKYKKNWKDALHSAIERGDTLQMTKEQADWFTKNYKKYYPTGKKYRW